MDVAVLGETIDEIRTRIPSLATTTTASGNGLSATDTKELEECLKGIQDAFKTQKYHFHGDQEVLVNRLRDLKTVVNDLSDLVEEISTNASPQERRLPILKPNPFKNRVKKVIKDLQNVAEKLRAAATTSSSELEASKKETKLDPAIEESLELVVGREKEKKEIIDQLISLRTKTIPVVTIVGFDGIGKTKLARLICEDEQVKSHFGFQIWRESETIDVESIKKDVNGSPKTHENGYLVVLDGLRTEIGDTDLLELQKILTGPGGAILITTRSKLVANKITASIRGNPNLGVHNSPITTFKPHVLQGLNEEDSLSLFRRIRELSSIDVKDDVDDDMVRQIVKDRGGVPLWIIITATFVNNRGRGGGEAPADLTLKKEFLQELKLRYYDKLPRIQKLCFAFCSLFPREHFIDVERLIHLWTAEGFLMEIDSDNSTREETFREHFNNFVGRPVFKDMEEDEHGVVRRCRMQPLMHDLARLVSDDEENITVDPEGERVHKRVLRASFDYSLDIWRGIPDSLFKKAKKLRAFLLWKTNMLLFPKEIKTSTSTCDKICKTFKTTLRMLDLHNMGIKTLPSSIGELINLRYLDLSLNTIEKLPGSIIKLSNLQTLKLSQCYFLNELPKNIEALINLKHLEIEGCLALTHMPPKIHKLNSLQTLSHFVVSEGYPLGGLGELAKLNSLGGHLEILHLERLNLKLSVAKDNCLKGKKHLQRLTLRWGHDQEDNQEHKNTMDWLKPPFESELTVLFIVGYKGSTLSSWLSSIKCLVKLSLYDCTSCKFLPQLDQLPKLRFLELLRLDNLGFIAENSDKDHGPAAASVFFFPSLEELTISDCPKLESWWKTSKKENDNIPVFPCISKLHVYYCPVLTCMPLYPCLDQELVLVDSSVQPLQDTIVCARRRRYHPFSKVKSMQIASIHEERSPKEKLLKYFSSLEKLDIRDCSRLKSLPKGFDQLSSLQRLTIENCQQLDLDLSSTEWEGLKNLRSLTIRENPKLKSLPLGVDKVTSMQDLELHNCPEMTYLPESIGNLKSLGRLVISECNKLASLPKGLKNLESLNTLIILDCTLLSPRCQPDTGDDWPQIFHIKNIQVTETFQDI